MLWIAKYCEYNAIPPSALLCTPARQWACWPVFRLCAVCLPVTPMTHMSKGAVRQSTPPRALVLLLANRWMARI